MMRAAWSLRGDGVTCNNAVTHQRKSNEDMVSTLVNALKQCGRQHDLDAGKALHLDAVQAGCHTNKYVASALISMYAKCRAMQDARAVFDGVVHRNVVLWTSLMLGYVESGESLTAMFLFTSMNCEPDSRTFIAALKACTGLLAEKRLDRRLCLEMGMSIHRQAKDRGMDADMFVATSLVHMYSKCSSMLHARAVFDTMTRRNVVSWTSLLLGYIERGQTLVALDLLERMDCEPDCLTFVAAFKACSCMADQRQSDRLFILEKGMAIHRHAKDRGLDSDIFVGTTLVEMYSNCASMRDARAVFDSMGSRNVVSWTSLLLGYVENGESLEAMDLLTRMECENNFVTLISAIKACTSLSASSSDKQLCLERGMNIHKHAKGRGFDAHGFVATNLLEMYSKCGSMQDAQAVFDSMVDRNVVSWTSLISGYLENGEGLIALGLFESMDCEPNNITFIAVLKACASVGALTVGQRVHAQICKLGVEQQHPLVATALVDFYGKCGNMLAAEHLFNMLHSWDIVPWSSLMAGYSSLGNTRKVFSVVKDMQENGIQMDGIAFSSILTACSHAGMVGEAIKCFESMATKYCMVPSMQHYSCMVDTLGRANRLQDALSTANYMPLEQVDSLTWKPLLGACNNLQVAVVAFDALIACDENDAAAYVFMADMYRKLAT